MDLNANTPAAENQKPEYRDATEAQATGFHLPSHGHNASPQQDVYSNPDLALQYSHEHLHQHLHHHKRSVQGHDDEVVYSHAHKPENSNVPDQNAQDGHRQAHYTGAKPEAKLEVMQHDAEKGAISPTSLSQEEDDPRSHKVSGFYARWKILFHAAILALITGYDRLLCLLLRPQF
jgi:hypothetical protein